MCRCNEYLLEDRETLCSYCHLDLDCITLHLLSVYGKEISAGFLSQAYISLFHSPPLPPVGTSLLRSILLSWETKEKYFEIKVFFFLPSDKHDQAMQYPFVPSSFVFIRKLVYVKSQTYQFLNSPFFHLYLICCLTHPHVYVF